LKDLINNGEPVLATSIKLFSLNKPNYLKGISDTSDCFGVSPFTSSSNEISNKSLIAINFSISGADSPVSFPQTGCHGDADT
jgi:hypothetical protein